MRLEMEELLVSCLLCFVANAIGSFSGSKSGELGKAWLWSSLQGTYLGGAEQCAATPETSEVVQVSTACGSLRFNKVVKQLEELDCWAAPAAIEPVGRLCQRLLIARVRPKVYIKSLHVSPIELTVR